LKSEEILKNRVIREIKKLPKDKLQEVLDFVEYLLSKERSAESVKPEEGLDPSQDPILKMIGRVSHGSLAKDIDKELYGE
jgi:hypothetical protein